PTRRAAWTLCLAAPFNTERTLTASAAGLALLQPVRRARHDSRGHLHHRARQRRQSSAARVERVVTMTLFVHAHLLHDRARARVRLRQSMQVSFEMLDHLPLRLGDEAEAGAVAAQSGERTDRE